MKISVVTACFNSDRTIKFAMKSVRSQSYKNIEHIIVDGGSTDNTLSIVKDFYSDNLKIISEPDDGIYDALNKGFNLASGDVFGILHSDDFFNSRDVIERIAKIFLDEKVDIVYGDLQYVDKLNPYKVVRNWVSGKYTHSRLKYGWMPPHPTIFFRRSVFESLGGFNLEYKISSDYDFIVRIFSAKDFAFFYLPIVVAVMRAGGVSNGSIRGVLQKSYEDYLIIKRNGIGGFYTLAAKNLRKIPQFFF